MNSSPKKVVYGSRFEVLSTEEESNAHETMSNITRIREMIINAGPTSSVKGKCLGAVGVGSSKGTAPAGVPRVRSVLDSLDAIKEVPHDVNVLHQNITCRRNKENTIVSNPSKSVMIASKGTVVQVDSSLSKTIHVVVRVVKDDQGGVLRDLNKKDPRKGSDKPVLADWIPLSLAKVNLEGTSNSIDVMKQHEDMPVNVSDVK
ncbi:hypothetical protein V6N13_060204 [Hibiscus sabdariffa]|uniref:Uncharacterized protein n=2 Tax=Hibiscus sabdariffa TaxID=183260 RepID=A0ABR2GAR3_9ROSI